MEKSKVGRPKKTDSREPTRVRDEFQFDDQQRIHMADRIRREFGDLSSDQIEQLVPAASTAATWFAAGFFPVIGKRGRSHRVATKILVYECRKAMEMAVGSGALWQRASADGGGESDAIGLARLIIEAVTGKPYPFDLRGMIDGAKQITK